MWCLRACGLISLMDWYNVKTRDIYGGKYDNKERNSNWAHMFPRVLGYKRGEWYYKGDITEVKM